MTRSVLDRLRDIVQSAELAQRHAGGLEVSGLAAMGVQWDAAVFRIAVVGEAASHLPTEVQAHAPEIPWGGVRGMRHHIIHGYWQIDFAMVAETIALDLDPLKLVPQRLIALLETSGA
jgi:uncharacterized protein with HEPN domain